MVKRPGERPSGQDLDRRRRHIPRCEHFTRKLFSVQPILVAISAALKPCAASFAISSKITGVKILGMFRFRTPVSHIGG